MKRWLGFALILVFCVVAVIAIANTGVLGTDFEETFYPAGQNLLHGQPIRILNPPWLVLPFAVLALLPIHWAYGLYIILSAAGTIWALYRLGSNWLATTLIVCSLPTIVMIGLGQVDWLVVLGATLPPAWGLFLVLVKPQLGIMVAAVWALRAWKNKTLIKDFAPVTIALVVAAGLFLLGIWRPQDVDVYNNTVGSLWPMAFPLALWLAYLAYQNNEIDKALLAGPLAMPFAGVYLWWVAFLPLRNQKRWLLLAWSVVWIGALIKLFRRDWLP